LKKSLLALLVIFVSHGSGHSADRVRIGFADLAAPFVPLAIADKKGFFQEEEIQAEFIRINPAIALQALVSDEIDYYTVLGPGVAAAIRGAPVGSPPLDFLGKKLGFVVLARAHELFGFPVSGLIASAKKIKERPDEIKRAIKAGIKTNRYIRQNRDGTIPVMAEWLMIDREMAVATYDSSVRTYSDDLSLPDGGLRLLIDEAKRVAKVNREVSLNEVADLSILRGAQKELGTTTK